MARLFVQSKHRTSGQTQVYADKYINALVQHLESWQLVLADHRRAEDESKSTEYATPIAVR